MAPANLKIDEEQALWFRARRSGLAGGHETPAVAARALLGAQAQQEAMALHGLGLRVASRPPARELKGLLAPPPALVRAWGQRDTLHVYDPADWRDVIASLDAWPRSGRRGGMPAPELLDRARRFFRAASEPVLKRDLFPLLPDAYLRELESHPGVGRSAPRLAASRLVWLLGREGEICFADKVGSEVRYAPRHVFFPYLDWPDVDTGDAMRRLLRRYLSTWAPATAADMAHFFGAKVGVVKERLAELAGDLTAVACSGRKSLLALTADADALRRAAPKAGGWPARLLPQWDGHLMTHKDKSWVVPAAAERPLVWRKAGVVAASLIDRGRVVATWRHRAARKRVTVTVSPLSGWRRRHLRDVEGEAANLAANLGVEAAAVVVE